jgi:DNA repair ATPase RecN
MTGGSQAAQLALRCERLQARLSAWQQSVRHAEARLARAQSFLSLAPKAQDVLEEAQRRIQQEIVGGLGDLLTFMLQGVMGDPERRVVCETEVDARGQSQVRFFVQRASGEREDILAGNGGSIANVVCTGLRLIAVSRAKHARPFLVLDEPDCWLSPDRVEPFVSLLQKAVDAVPGGMQVLMITHHDVHDEDGDINTLELLRQDGRVQVRSHIKRCALSGQIERIELRDWRSHAHTVITMGAGLNVLKGANNLGKSAVVEALRCLAYGGARADCVAHGADEASVCVHLMDGQTVSLRRARRGTPAVLYRWTDAQGAVVREEAGARGAGAPPWMEQALGIRAEQGLEIHIADQKKPVFLLDEPASRQTAILSVGQEAQEIVAVLDRYKDAKRQAQQMAREAQAQLEAARRLQLALGDMPDWSARARDLIESGQKIEQALEREAQAQALWQQMRRLQGLQEATLPQVPHEPTWHDTPRAAALAEQLRRLGSLRVLRAPALAELPPWKDSPGAARLLAALRRLKPVLAVQVPQVPALPVLPDVAAVRKMAQDLARLRHLYKVNAPQVPSLPAYKDHSAIKALQERIEMMKAEGNTARALLKEGETEYAAQAEVVRELETQLGTCPLCGTPFGEPATGTAVRGRSACDVAAHRTPH